MGITYWDFPLNLDGVPLTECVVEVEMNFLVDWVMVDLGSL